MIHDRDAHDDVLRVLAEEGAPTVARASPAYADVARRCLDRGALSASPAR
ncbi:MAG: hypothetical protein R2731_05175 [Nocardioides sp.]